MTLSTSWLRPSSWTKVGSAVFLSVTLGCATSGVTRISSEPSGAAVYQLRGGHITYYVGTTPAQWSESVGPGPTLPFGSPAPDVISSIALFPFFFPVALATWIGGALQSLLSLPRKRAYAALYHGRFSTPTSISKREVHFDFSTSAGQPIPHNFIRNLRERFLGGVPSLRLQKELGEPRAKTHLPDGKERWDYGDFEVITGYPPKTILPNGYEEWDYGDFKAIVVPFPPPSNTPRVLDVRPSGQESVSR